MVTDLSCYGYVKYISFNFNTKISDCAKWANEKTALEIYNTQLCPCLPAAKCVKCDCSHPTPPPPTTTTPPTTTYPPVKTTRFVFFSVAKAKVLSKNFSVTIYF
jgi:hypothetical protein